MGINANANLPSKSFILYLPSGIPLYLFGCFAIAVLLVNFYNKILDYYLIFVLYLALGSIGAVLTQKGIGEWKKMDILENQKMKSEIKNIKLQNKKLEIEIKLLKRK
ncbi:hypothetical protein HYS31_00110 [Candidatus Woesearchaeota archaeon]|nr:hypothetical protein [Candidatus Woesearchaeota archaeon]